VTVAGVATLPGSVTGLQLACQATLKNPSLLNIFLGDLTFDVEYKKITVGRAAADNVTLIPGNNSIQVKGVVFRDSIANNSVEAEELFSAIVAGEAVAFLAKGVEARVNGRVILWLTELVKTLKLSVVFQPAKADVMQGLKLSNMNFRFAEDESKASLCLGGKIRSTIQGVLL
jgi:hypothetical protein